MIKVLKIYLLIIMISFLGNNVKANYEKLHGMGYSKRDALSQGKEKQLQSTAC